MSDEQVARFNVLLENIQSQITAIAEGHGELVQALTAQGARLESFDVKVDRFAAHVDQRLGDVDTRLDRIEHRLDLNGAPAKKRPAPKPRSRKK